MRLLLFPLLLSSTCALRVVTSRRVALGALAGFASPALPPALANTMPAIEGTMAGFDADEAKREKYQQMQKAYKKAWRKELSNLEFASTDAEAMSAIKAISKMVRDHNGEIPQGVRKQDLDQVYKRVKDTLAKPTRMAFLDLDAEVRTAVTVKDLRADDQTPAFWHPAARCLRQGERTVF